MKSNVANGIPRREFLRIGSVAALGVAVVSITEGNLFAAAGDSRIVPLMGVGYAPSLPLPGYSIPLASAETILSPDPRFIRSGARVAVVAAKRATRHANVAGGIAVDALFPVSHRRPDDPQRFSFFSMNGGADHDAISGPIAFTVPVLSTTGVSLVVRRVRPMSHEIAEVPPPLEPEIAPIMFSLGNVAGPKLTRGVYVLAFREEESDSMIDWRRMTIAPASDGGYVISGATFSYVVLNIDYADEPVPERHRVAS